MMRHVALPDASVPAPGKRSLLRLEGKMIALFNVDETLYAIDDSCPHAGGSLLTGKLDGRTLQCPAHGLKFDLHTGCMAGGKGLAVRSYAVGLVNGCMSIALPDSTSLDSSS